MCGDRVIVPDEVAGVGRNEGSVKLSEESLAFWLAMAERDSPEAAEELRDHITALEAERDAALEALSDHCSLFGKRAECGPDIGCEPFSGICCFTAGDDKGEGRLTRALKIAQRLSVAIAGPPRYVYHDIMDELLTVLRSQDAATEEGK